MDSGLLTTEMIFLSLSSATVFDLCPTVVAIKSR